MNVEDAIHDEVWEQDVYRVRQRILPGVQVLDIGASVGSFAVPCAMGGAHVLALEPHVPSLERLRVRSRGLLVTAGGWALGPRRGTCSVEERGHGVQVSGWGSGETHQVPIEHLGSWDVCKIDIEGAEYDALIGADLSGLKYIALEFHVQRPVGSPYDASIGEGALPFVPGSVERLYDWIGRTHDTEFNGDVNSGGYMYGVLR